jgi:hypothetical protein
LLLPPTYRVETIVSYNQNDRSDADDVFTALLVCGGAAVYPVGWNNREVLESCGNASSVYNLGKYRALNPWDAGSGKY